MTERTPPEEFLKYSAWERGRPLTGTYWHWCMDWDYLTIDETCPEWPCGCGIVEYVDGLGAKASPPASLTHVKPWPDT